MTKIPLMVPLLLVLFTTMSPPLVLASEPYNQLGRVPIRGDDSDGAVIVQ